MVYPTERGICLAKMMAYPTEKDRFNLRECIIKWFWQHNNLSIRISGVNHLKLFEPLARWFKLFQTWVTLAYKPWHFYKHSVGPSRDPTCWSWYPWTQGQLNRLNDLPRICVSEDGVLYAKFDGWSSISLQGLLAYPIVKFGTPRWDGNL